MGVIIIMSHKLAPRWGENWTDSLARSFSRNRLIHLDTFQSENRVCTVISFSVMQQPQAGLGWITAEVSISRTHARTHTHKVWLLWTNDQLVVEAANNTIHNQHERRTLTHSAGFEPMIPAIKRPQGYVLVRTVTGVGLCNKYKSKFPLAYSGLTRKHTKTLNLYLINLTLFIPLC